MASNQRNIRRPSRPDPVVKTVPRSVLVHRPRAVSRVCLVLRAEPCTTDMRCATEHHCLARNSAWGMLVVTLGVNGWGMHPAGRPAGRPPHLPLSLACVNCARVHAPSDAIRCQLCVRGVCGGGKAAVGVERWLCV
jgi:hypothetical protein